jgi:hypothetical protein
MRNERLAIARDLKEAVADAKSASAHASGEVARAVDELRGGTEEDAHRFEELCTAPALQACAGPASRLTRTLSMKFQHESRTGHRVIFDTPGT